MTTIQEKAQAIRDAVKGLGTNDDALIKLFRTTPYADRLALSKEYYTQFKRDLIDDIKGDTSGNYCKILVNLLRSKEALLADFVRKSVKGLKTNDDILIYALTQFPEYLSEARKIYTTKYDTDMYDDIKKATHGNFKKFLLALLEDKVPDEDDDTDILVEFLYKAGVGKIGTDEPVFVNVLGKHSKAKIKTIAERYNEEYKMTLAAAIKSEMKFKLGDALVAQISNRYDYFAGVLLKAVKGLGTDDDDVVFVFSMLEEDEIKKVSHAYYKLYRKSLLNDLRGDTSGNYQKLLIAQIN